MSLCSLKTNWLWTKTTFLMYILWCSTEDQEGECWCLDERSLAALHALDLYSSGFCSSARLQQELSDIALMHWVFYWSYYRITPSVKNIFCLFLTDAFVSVSNIFEMLCSFSALLTAYCDWLFSWLTGKQNAVKLEQTALLNLFTLIRIYIFFR